ncbi:MAG: hypothetical protein ACYCSD_00835 [Acidiferrobacteraceae bacterium]
MSPYNTDMPLVTRRVPRRAEETLQCTGGTMPGGILGARHACVGRGTRIIPANVVAPPAPSDTNRPDAGDPHSRCGLNPAANGTAEEARMAGWHDTTGVYPLRPDALFRNNPCLAPGPERDTHDGARSGRRKATTRRDITR